MGLTRGVLHSASPRARLNAMHPQSKAGALQPADPHVPTAQQGCAETHSSSEPEGTLHSANPPPAPAAGVKMQLFGKNHPEATSSGETQVSPTSRDLF